LIEADSKSVLTFSLTDPSVHDTVELPKLVYAVQCKLSALYADAGYLSVANCMAVAMAGGTPYIRPKRTNRRPERASNPFQRMLHDYLDNPEAWLKQYHVRSRVESTFSAIKRRLGEGLASVTKAMLRIEATLRILAWNLTRVLY
jgi:transposase